MSAALLQFTQGGNVGGNGQALVGSLGSSVTVNNTVNTGIGSWQIELVYVPVGSAVSTGVIAHNDNSSTPTTTFTPDVTGSYRIVLKVWNGINRVGTPTDTDIRVFAVPETRTSLIKPPYQAWPQPLPLTPSGSPGAKDDEMNFNAQSDGWVGTGSDGLMDDVIKAVDRRVAISAGTQSGITGNIVFSNSNGISFGMSGSSQVTASHAINISAGTTSNNLSAFTFSNSNGVSFGLNGSTLTASIQSPKASQLVFPQANPWQTNFAIANGSFSFQNIDVGLNLVATRANLLMVISGNSNSTGAVTVSLGMYTKNGSTMSLASSDSRAISWTSGSDTTISSVYGGVSGTQYQTVPLNNWSLTSGEYMLGMWFRTTNNGTCRVFGVQGPTIANALDANQTNGYLNGHYVSSFSTAMLGSINVTDTNYIRTGGNALQQPGIILMGTF